MPVHAGQGGCITLARGRCMCQPAAQFSLRKVHVFLQSHLEHLLLSCDPEGRHYPLPSVAQQKDGKEARVSVIIALSPPVSHLGN